MIKQRIIVVGLSAFALACASSGTLPNQAGTAGHQIETLSDPSMDVTVDVNRGGAIVGLDIIDGPMRSGNLVDNGDQTGRSIQASLYNGHWPPDFWPCPGGTVTQWGWNVVQEGDACQTLSGGQVAGRQPTLITTTVPRQWNPSIGNTAIALQQQLTIAAPGVLRVDYTLTNHTPMIIGSDNWHELPCVYLSPSMTLGTTSQGQEVRASMQAFRDGSQWVALTQEGSGWTVAVVAPGDHLWSIAFGGGDKPTSFMQAWQWLELAPEQTGTATAWLVVGSSLQQVRERIATIH